jgi:hypothetical protein
LTPFRSSSCSGIDAVEVANVAASNDKASELPHTPGSCDNFAARGANSAPGSLTSLGHTPFVLSQSFMSQSGLSHSLLGGGGNNNSGPLGLTCDGRQRPPPREMDSMLHLINDSDDARSKSGSSGIGALMSPEFDSFGSSSFMNEAKRARSSTSLGRGGGRTPDSGESFATATASRAGGNDSDLALSSSSGSSSSGNSPLQLNTI